MEQERWDWNMGRLGPLIQLLSLASFSSCAFASFPGVTRARLTLAPALCLSPPVPDLSASRADSLGARAGATSEMLSMSVPSAPQPEHKPSSVTTFIAHHGSTPLDPTQLDTDAPSSGNSGLRHTATSD